MGNKKRSLNFLLLLMSLIVLTSFISAVKPTTQVNSGTEGIQIYFPDYEYVKQNQEFMLHLHTSNMSNGVQFNNTQVDCFLHLYNSTGSHTLESGVLVKDSNKYDHELLIDGGNFSDLGSHSFYIWCNRTNVVGVSPLGGEARGTFEVTINGKELTTNNIIFLYVFFMILFILMGVVYYIVSRNVNYEKWYKGIVQKYENRNIIKTLLSSIFYMFAKETYITYYILAAPVFIIFRDLIITYGLTSLTEVMNYITVIYLVGLLGVSLIFFGKIQEFVVSIINNIKDMEWGINDK